MTDYINDQVYKCLIVCDAYGRPGGKVCPVYISLEEKEVNGLCAYYETVSHDLEKLKAGDHCLTFPQLENILKGEKK